MLREAKLVSMFDIRNLSTVEWKSTTAKLELFQKNFQSDDGIKLFCIGSKLFRLTPNYQNCS